MVLACTKQYNIAVRGATPTAPAKGPAVLFQEGGRLRAAI